MGFSCPHRIPETSTELQFLGGGVTFLPINPDGSLAKHKPDHFFLPEYKPLRHPRQYGSHPHQVCALYTPSPTWSSLME
jgi:hypothetical protein